MRKTLGPPVKNTHKVPKKQWGRWSNLAKRVFNRVMHTMRFSMQFTFLHPTAYPSSREHWQTTRWNSAWAAAEAVSGFTLKTATQTENLWTKERRRKVARARKKNAGLGKLATRR